MRDKFLISRDETVNNCWHDASITLSYLVKCVSCARTIPSHVLFPVLICCCLGSSRTVCFFISTVRSWRCRDVTLVETDSIAGEFCSQTGFFGHELIACCFCFLLCGMQGVQHVVESRGIGVDVHLPSVALKAFVGGSHGHCWVELRYLLPHLQYTVSTCRSVKARSDWFESSWSKRHMLTRADVRDSDRPR